MQVPILFKAILLMLCCSAQVCGVFLLFISGTHTLMYWGLYCYPWLRDGFIVAYYLAALGCVLGGLRAKTQMQRALPMLALFGVRFLCLGARMVLNSGSQSACIHYAAMEVSLASCLRTWSLGFSSGAPAAEDQSSGPGQPSLCGRSPCGEMAALDQKIDPLLLAHQREEKGSLLRKSAKCSSQLASMCRLHAGDRTYVLLF